MQRQQKLLLLRQKQLLDRQAAIFCLPDDPNHVYVRTNPVVYQERISGNKKRN